MSPEKKMDRAILTQSLFHTTSLPTPWRSHLTSGIVHGALILAALLFTFPMIQKEVEKRRVENVTLIAPRIPEYQPKITVQRHIQPAPTLPRKEVKLKPLTVLKSLVRPPEVRPRVVAAAPELKSVLLPAAVQPLPDLKLKAPAPKPEVRTGTFQTADAAKAPQVPQVLQVGGFGDPRGVAPSANARPSAVTMARVGSFDLPEGAGTAGGGGQAASGGVRQANFGSVVESGTSTGTTHGGGGTVHTSGFGDSAALPIQTTNNAHPKPVEPVFTPVEILSKPKPAYTDEARNLKLEGQVSLEVVFQSSGSVRILRIVHGLGHGLDEAAEQAALQVRFRPATRGGVPVDSNATIHITFQLT